MTIGKIKQGSLSILELVWGGFMSGRGVLEPSVTKFLALTYFVYPLK